MRLKREIVLTAVFSALMFMGAAPVFAGFEWKPPAASVTAPAPAAANESIQWNDKSGPAMPAQKVQSIESIPLLTDAEKKKMPASSPADVLSGFGTDLPLTIALQQIVPPEYKVSFATGVNPDVSVSWQGEKPWKQVLADMLAAQGLSSSFRDKVVVVAPLADAATPVKRAAASSKADMIPADMISGSKKKDSAPLPMTIRRDIPADADSNNVAVATPAPAPVPVAAPAPESVWRATKGQTLRDILGDWSKLANVELYWSIDYDYRLKDTVTYGGNFPTAVEKLFNQFAQARPQPYGSLHQNPDGGGVLVVNTYDNPN